MTIKCILIEYPGETGKDTRIEKFPKEEIETTLADGVVSTLSSRR